VELVAVGAKFVFQLVVGAALGFQPVDEPGLQLMAVGTALMQRWGMQR